MVKDSKNDFALVRKPSSAVEKAAPGAKRILSGITVDALTLAKKKSSLKIVLIDDEAWLLEMVKMAIHAKFKNVTIQTFQDSRKAMQELLHEEPDLLITRDKMPWLTGEDIVQRLVNRNVNYPIIVGGGWSPSEEWVRKLAKKKPNITFLLYPFTTEQLYRELSKNLGSKLQFQNKKS